MIEWKKHSSLHFGLDNSSQIKTLAKEMEKSYGKGLNQRNLYYYVRFYDYFPQILNAVSSKSPILSWTHYRCLLQVPDKEARDWYEKEALSETWSSRTLQRNISTQYYYLSSSQIAG
jgi:hypothetical protein